jgi:glucose-6-phosphate isomerase
MKSHVAHHLLRSMMQPMVTVADEMLRKGTGAGSTYTDWLHLPIEYDKDEFARIQAAAKKIQSDSKVLVVIGIGGSYLGARAAIDFLNEYFNNYLLDEQRNVTSHKFCLLKTQLHQLA